MSILDIATNVLTLYKADTSDQKAKLKELSGIEKEHAKAALDAAETRNKATESTIDKLGKLGLAFSTITQVARAAFSGLEDYGHKLDLQAAAGSVSIDKLSKAASGLKSEMELLTHAAVFNKSAFGLTEDQMATVERGMHALEERGKNAEEVWGAVSTVLTKGTTKALEGLIGPIQKSSDAFDVNGDVIQTYGARAKAVDAILKQLSKTSAEAAEGDYDEADRIQSITVRITDSMDHIKESMGKMVVALEPLIRGVARLGEAAGSVVNTIAEGWQNLSDVAGFATGGISREEFLKRIGQRGHVDLAQSAGSDRLENYLAQGGSTANFIGSQLMQSLGQAPSVPGTFGSDVIGGLTDLVARGDMVGERAMALIAAGGEKMRKRYEAGQRLAQQLTEERKKLANEVAKAGGEALLKQLEDEDGGVSLVKWIAWHSNNAIGGTGFTATGSKRGGQWNQFVEDNRATSLPGLQFGYDAGGGGGEFRDYSPTIGRAGDKDALEKAMQTYYGDYFKTGSATSGLGKTMATSYTQFQKNKTASFLEQTFGKIEEFNVYKSAFDSLSNAVVAGFEAWITGSKSFSDAFREALSKTMLGEALSMAAQAIKATALGIFSAATGDAPHAALYFTSAAEFGAAAIAFGVGAAALGGGGSSSARGGSAGASAPNVAASSAAPAPTSSIVVITDSFAEDTARMRQIRAERAIALARGKNGIEYA